MALFKLLLLYFVTVTYAHVCTTEVATPNGRIVTFVDCNPIFEICCNAGCCPRLSHAHIWLITGIFSFLLVICIFGCWLLCCKNMRGRIRRSRNVQSTPGGDNVASPLTLVISENRSEAPNQNANSTIPVTPPPSYEEATSMR